MKKIIFMAAMLGLITMASCNGSGNKDAKVKDSVVVAEVPSVVYEGPKPAVDGTMKVEISLKIAKGNTEGEYQYKETYTPNAGQAYPPQGHHGKATITKGGLKGKGNANAEVLKLAKANSDKVLYYLLSEDGSKITELTVDASGSPIKASKPDVFKKK